MEEILKIIEKYSMITKQLIYKRNVITHRFSLQFLSHVYIKIYNNLIYNSDFLIKSVLPNYKIQMEYFRYHDYQSYQLAKNKYNTYILNWADYFLNTQYTFL